MILQYTVLESNEIHVVIRRVSNYVKMRYEHYS